MPIPDNNINTTGEKKFPHLYLKREGELGVDWWKCEYCEKEGTCDDLSIIHDCSYCPPPCEFCQQTPICAPDCIGILGVLASPEVHVCGTIPEHLEVSH